MKAVDSYTDIGLFGEAAKNHRKIAEIYEEEEASKRRAAKEEYDRNFK